MKKRPLLIVGLLFTLLLQAQDEPTPLHQFKANLIYGTILKHTKHLQELETGPIMGVELDYEMLTLHESRDWYRFFGYPKLGVGAVYLDLGNTDMLGSLLALYPYLNFSLIDLKWMQLNLKAGAGLSYLNKTFNNTMFTDENGWVVLNKSNAAIGSHLNVYFAFGGELEVPLTRAVSLVAGAGWNHASNGSFYQPNSGINMINSSIGISYFPNFERLYTPAGRHYPDLPRRFGMDISISGGLRELYFRDDLMFPTGSVVVSVHRQLSNRFRLGLAVDGFYDGVYASVNSSTDPAKNISTYKFTYLTEDLMENRFRVGMSLQPELVFGRLTAGFHFGVYLWNPIKNLEPYDDAKAGTLNKPLFYAYNIEKEHGWFYTRASLKYLVTEHLFLNLGLKTHLQKAEFIEWGLGWRL